MTTQALVERLHDWIEDNAAIDWPYPTLPADRAEVLRAAASRLSEMDAEIKRLEKERAYAVRWGEGAVESVKEVMWRYEDALKQIEGGHVPGMANLVLAHDWHAVVNLFQARARAALEHQQQKGERL